MNVNKFYTEAGILCNTYWCSKDEFIIINPVKSPIFISPAATAVYIWPQ